MRKMGAMPRRPQAGVGDIAEVLPHVAHGKTGNAAGEQVFGELRFGIDGFAHHVDDVCFKRCVPEIGLLRADDIDDFKGEFEMAAFVAKDPVGAGGQAVQQALGAQEVDIGEGCEEEQAFDAGGKADRGSAGTGGAVRGFRSSSSFWMESIHFMQKSAFFVMEGMFSTAAKAAARASGSGT